MVSLHPFLMGVGWAHDKDYVEDDMYIHVYIHVCMWYIDTCTCVQYNVHAKKRQQFRVVLG